MSYSYTPKEMDVQNIGVAIWMLVIGLTSLILTLYIVRYIHNKPLLSITLVDLIFCDILCWVYIAESTYTSAVFACHISPR